MNTRDAALALIGSGCLFPGAGDLDAYWARIKGGADGIGDVPPTHWRPEDYYHPDPKAPDRVYTARGGFLEAVPFNPAAFGIAPNSLEATDTAQLLGLLVAQQALADAGYSPGGRPFDRARASVILGVTGTLELVIPLGARLGHPIWRRALREAGVAEHVADDVVQRIADSYVGWQENSFPGLLGNVVAGRIANRFDLGGTNCVVDAACASSLAAVHLAALELTSGRADLVLTGGVDTFNDVFMFTCFSKTPALSPTGDARPFATDADGTILGEGVGMVVLKRLADARRDGDRIYAVLKGIGTSSDGKGNAVYAPRAEGQVEALRSAYDAASVTPDTIELVEAHGTGTRVGDATEASALTEVYRASGRPGSWCALGSVKSQIGHTKAAAGAAGLIKAALALHHKVLPPTIKVRQPIEVLQAGHSPLYLNTDKRPWMPSTDHPRRAAVSAFGFGGSNFHCVLEEASPDKAVIDWNGDVDIVALSADSPDRLRQELADWPDAPAWDEWRARSARSRAAFRPESACRLLLVAQRGKTELARLLTAARTRLAREGDRPWRLPEGVFYGRGTPGQLAVLFPGQGAQAPGMLRDLTCQFPALHDTVAEADRLYPSGDGPRLTDYIYPQPAFTPEGRRAQEDALRDTHVAQPALGAVSLGAWRLLEQFGVRADAAAGHSYGELTALCIAGRLGAHDFHTLSALRGRLMAAQGNQADPGAMLAVLAPAETITAVLRAEGLDLVLANKNAPRQTVLSGLTPDVERAQAAFTARQVRVQRLAVAGAFHSPLVAAAAVPFRQALEQVTLHPGRIPVVANTTAAPYPDDAHAARDLLAGQLARPVEFVAQIEHLYRTGVRTFLEVGPGARLTALVDAILEGREHEALALDASAGSRPGIFDLACCLAGLAALGQPLRLTAWDNAAPSPEPTADARKPSLVVPLCGANYVKPRPQHSPVTANGDTLPAAPIPATNESTNVTMNGSTREPTALPPAEVPAPAPVAAPASGTLAQALQTSRDSLAALQKMQEQTAQLHRQFLEGQESAQRTIHLLVEQQQRLLQASLGLPVAPPPLLAPAAEAPPAPIAPVAPAPSPAAAAPTMGTNDHVESVLLEIVAEKTGYPAEMLELDMALDADLGIDSIKRVEILSALQERLPEAPAVRPEHLGTLTDLRKIAAFLANGHPAPSAPAPTITPSSAPAEERVQSILLEVVAEKTGYPAEMLELDMALDADLGIDSIKRVEILSALQERLPEAPAVRPEHLGTLTDLRKIAAFLANGHPAPSAPPHPAAPDTFSPTAPTREPELPPSILERSVLRAVPLGDSVRPSIRPRPGAEVWVTAEDAPLAQAIEHRLRSLGVLPRLMPCAALRDLELPASLGGLVILTPARGADDTLLRDALLGLRHAAPALRRAGDAFFVTVSRLDGAFGLLDLDPDREPLDGGLAGLAKTARHEWPEVRCKALDLADDFTTPDDAAAVFVAELLLDGPAEVGLARSGRRTLERVAEPLPAATATPLMPGDVVVLTGGARGVTAEAAVALARAFRPTLVLFGRSPEPGHEPDWLIPLTTETEIKRELGVRANGDATPRLIGEQYQVLAAQREVRRTLERIEANGARAFYRSVDVRDPPAVAAALDDVRRRFGPMRGLVHGAGVLADARIEDKTAEQFDRVYGTKVLGLRALLAALDPAELRVLALFSSSTARFGRAGQADYAIANEVFNKVARQLARRLPACRVVALDWGPWDGGMVTPGLKALFTREGIGLIPLDAGAACLVREVCAPPGVDAEVVILAPVGPASRAGPGDGPSEVVAPSLSPRPLPTAFERVLDLAEHPILESHVLDGRPVLPMALTLEWLAHAALHQNPGLAFNGCNDLRILHGVVLDGPPLTLRLGAAKATPRDGLYLALAELRGLRPDGREVLHARAEVVLADVLPSPPPPRPLPALGTYPHTPEEVYRRLLFHGPDLQAIERIDGYGPRGIAGRVRTAPAPSAWLRRPLRQRWLTDPLAFDAALQLLVLWGRGQHGAPGLPCFAARYRQFRRTFPAGGVRIALEITRASGLHALADVDFLDDAGAVVARLEGQELVLDPALDQAFRRNRLCEMQH